MSSDVVQALLDNFTLRRMSASYKPVMTMVFLKHMQKNDCSMPLERLAQAFLEFYLDRQAQGRDVERVGAERELRVLNLEYLVQHPESVNAILIRGPLHYITDRPGGKQLFQLDEESHEVSLRDDLCRELQSDTVRDAALQECETAIRNYYEKYCESGY